MEEGDSAEEGATGGARDGASGGASTSSKKRGKVMSLAKRWRGIKVKEAGLYYWVQFGKYEGMTAKVAVGEGKTACVSSARPTLSKYTIMRGIGQQEVRQH